MNEKKVRFAIIGADFTLRALMAMWYPKDLGELAAICDWNPEMLEKFRKDYGAEYPNVRLVRSFDEVLAMDDVDAVFVMVRDQYHEEMAVAALEAGKAVYLEKPMALSIEGCDRILEAAVRNKGRLFVGHNMRYVDSILKMKEVIDSGAIGQVQSVWVRHFVNYGSCYFRHWCGCQATRNGLLLQKGAHDIDIILVFSQQTADASAYVHSRVFAPKFGYLEDPATGSGNSAFANYLLSENLWDGHSITIEQGGNNRIFNSVKLRYSNGQVLFGGKATVRIEGEYLL